MKRHVFAGALGSIAALVHIGMSGPADARIVCNGPYQVINGNELATPWCEDNYLARVARSYGMRVSDRAVRQNPNLKQRVCLTVGHDIRVSNICAGLRNEDGGRRFP